MTRIMLLLPLMGAVVVIIGVATTGIFKKQAGAWCITALMVVAAVFIGLVRSPRNSPVPEDVPVPHPSAGLQQGPGTAPPLAVGSFVQDDAGVLSNRTEEALDARNQRLYERYDVIVGVAACNYGGDDPYTYVTTRFADMGLGGDDMLVVLDISGDNYWMYTGDRVGRQFSSEDCDNYAWDYMEGWFAQGDYDNAVLDLTEALEVWYGNNYS